MGRLLRETGRADEAAAALSAALDLFQRMNLTIEIETTAGELRSLTTQTDAGRGASSHDLPIAKSTR